MGRTKKSTTATNEIKNVETRKQKFESMIARLDSIKNRRKGAK